MARSHRQRYREIARVLSRNGMYATAAQAGLARWLPASGSGRVDPRHDDDIRPEILAQTFHELGTTFIKLGQMLAMRRDLLPAEYVEALGTLVDDVPPVPVAELETVVEEDLGRPVGEVFARFDPVPLASASIGQVHTAALPDGREVVVKIRKPGVVEQVERDLEILADLSAHLARNSRRVRDLGLNDLVAEFSRSLRAELTYPTEAHALEDFREFFFDDERVLVPWVHWETSGPRVLTMQRLGGLHVDDVAGLDAAGIDRPRLARECADLLLRTVFEKGDFHADPHAGNLFVQPDGALGVIDFGMVGHLGEDLRRHLVTLVLGVYLHDDGLVADALIALAPPQGELDRRRLQRDAARVVATLRRQALADVSFGEVAARLLDMVHSHRLALPGDVVLLLRMLTITDGLGRTLDPTFHLTHALDPYARRLLLDSLTPEEVADRLRGQALAALRLGRELPGHLRRLLERLESGSVDVHVRAAELDPLLARVERMSDRIVAGMLEAALIGGGARMLAANKDDLGPWGRPVLYGGSAALGLMAAYLAWTGRPRHRPR